MMFYLGKLSNYCELSSTTMTVKKDQCSLTYVFG